MLTVTPSTVPTDQSIIILIAVLVPLALIIVITTIVCICKKSDRYVQETEIS